MKRVENVCGPFFVSFPPFSFPYRNIILGIIGKDKKFQQIKQIGDKKKKTDKNTRTLQNQRCDTRFHLIYLAICLISSVTPREQ